MARDGKHRRGLTFNESGLVAHALINAASHERLTQINSDLLAETKPFGEGSEDSIRRLREAAVEADKRRNALETLAKLVMEGRFTLEADVIIPEVT